MKKKLSIKVVFLTLILVFTIFTGCVNKDSQEEKIEYLSIQQKINRANPNDVVHISNGIYNETILIEKPLTLIGEKKGETILDGQGEKCVIHITASNVKISNFTIRNSGGQKYNAGLKISSNDNLVENCIFYRTKSGVLIDEAKNNVISNCRFHTNGEGIFCLNSDNNEIIDSQFDHNAFGLHLLNSDETCVKNSFIHTNGLGIYARESENLHIVEDAISDNNQDGGGCWLFDCKNSLIDNCNIDHNGAGIKLKNSDSKITNCSFYYNMYNTIRLEESTDLVITNCDIINSYRSAVFIQNSNCKINNNNFEDSLLFGLECDRGSTVDAKNNWWDSKIGPSLTELGAGEKVSFLFRDVKIYPKSKNQIENIGANWDTADVFSKSEYDAGRSNEIVFEDIDSDNDGLPDWWEEKWSYAKYEWEDHTNLDPDGDGLNNFEECYTDKYGSDPFFKDVFIEVDWVKSKESDVTNKPPQEFIDKAVELFADHDINIHIDYGNLDGGEEIPVTDTSTIAELRDIYWDYFLQNDLNNPRKGIFHYTVLMNDNEEMYGGFVFVGWDHLDTTGICLQRMQGNHPNEKRGNLIIFGIVHELGHQMGLLIDDFDGIDNTQSTKYVTLQALKYRNYKSCLNYKYFLKILDYSDGSRGKNDFDDWGNLDFSFFKNTYYEMVEK